MSATVIKFRAPAREAAVVPVLRRYTARIQPGHGSHGPLPVLQQPRPGADADEGRGMTTPLMLAEEYGLPVFPCGANKQPLTVHGFKDASRSIEIVANWWDRYPDALTGIPTGRASKLLVVDVDPDGSEWYRQNAERLACGYTQRTQRGHHLFYIYPDVEIRNSASKLARGVDVRGEGGYVVAWAAQGLAATGSWDDIGPAPAWLIEALTQPEASSRAPAQGLNGNAYPEGQRNDSLFRLACRLRRSGLTADEIRVALDKRNATHCNPPLPDAEVAAIAASAGRYEQGGDRVRQDDAPPADQFPPIDVLASDDEPDGTTQEDSAKLRGRDVEQVVDALLPVGLDCLEVEPEPAEFVIPGYLPVELVLRSAPGGLGKSTLVVQEAISIVTGTPLFGIDSFTIEKRGPVVIVTAEDDEKRIKRRIHYIFKAMLAAGDFRDDRMIDADDLRRIKAQIAEGIFIKDVSARPARLVQLDMFSQAQNLVLSPFVDELIEQLKALDPLPVMVVLDPAIQFSAGSRFGQDGDALLVTACRRILREVGCTVLLIDHSGKQQARERVTDQYARRGSTALPDGCRAIHVLNHVEAGDGKTLPLAITEKDVEERRVLRLDVPKLTDGKPWSGSLLLVRDHWRFTAHWGAGKPDEAETRQQAQTDFYQAVEKVVAFVLLHPGIGYGEVRDRHKEIGIGRDQVAAARDHAIVKGRIEERREAGKTRPLRSLFPIDSADSAR